MPCDNLGFCRGGVFDEYPFLLPNLFCVAVLLIGITVGILFLEETHVDKTGRPDLGRQLAKRLFAFGRTKDLQNPGKSALALEGQTSLFDNRDPLPGYRTTESSPLLRSALTTEIDCEKLQEKEQGGAVKTFSKRVVLIVIAYAILA